MTKPDRDDDEKDREDREERDDDDRDKPDGDHKPKPSCRYQAKVWAEQVDGQILYRWSLEKTDLESGSKQIVGSGTRAQPSMAWTEAQEWADVDRQADEFGTQTMEV